MIRRVLGRLQVLMSMGYVSHLQIILSIISEAFRLYGKEALDTTVVKIATALYRLYVNITCKCIQSDRILEIERIWNGGVPFVVLSI